ncbi:hypothetical protein ACFFX1_15445 [Dactylosporangium sucinum]|uniref:hypothetical protein n=1 Tax=Dactylosporangium sucinum TaxID=1424081 RepID=UPI00167D7F20|nr:hypothetical protein [Dactylosporangium sucinum]
MTRYPWRALLTGLWRTGAAFLITACFVAVTGLIAGRPGFAWLLVGSVLSLGAAVPGYLVHRAGAPDHTAPSRIVMLLVLTFTAWLTTLLVLPVYMANQGRPVNATVTQITNGWQRETSGDFPVFHVRDTSTGEDLGGVRFLDGEPRVGDLLAVRVDPRGWFNVTAEHPVGRFTTLALIIAAGCALLGFVIGAGGHMPDD